MSKLIGYNFGSPFKIFQNTTSASTSSTVIVYLSGVLIPNDTYRVGDFVRAYAMFEKIGANGGYDVRLYWNTTNDLSGSPVLLGVLSATTTNAATYNIWRQIKIFGTTGANSVILPTDVTTDTNDIFPRGSRPSFVNIDWTVNSYIIAAADCGSASDSIRVHYLKVANG